MPCQVPSREVGTDPSWVERRKRGLDVLAVAFRSKHATQRLRFSDTGEGIDLKIHFERVALSPARE